MHDSELFSCLFLLFDVLNIYVLNYCWQGIPGSSGDSGIIGEMVSTLY